MEFALAQPKPRLMKCTNKILMSLTNKTNICSILLAIIWHGALGKQTNQQLCDLVTEALATKYVHTHESMQAGFSF